MDTKPMSAEEMDAKARARAKLRYDNHVPTPQAKAYVALLEARLVALEQENKDLQEENDGLAQELSQCE